MTLPPPPEDLSAFYDVERAAPTLMDADTQARILERVRLVADIATPAATATAVGIGVKTMLTVAALSFAAGGVVGHVATRATHEAPEASAPIAIAETAETEEVEEVEEVEGVEVEEVEVPVEPIEEIEPTRDDADMHAAAPARQDLSRERRLLDSATAAIARRNWSDAERALARHGRVFPRGALVEEREALRVRVAFEDGRYDAAEGLAQRFLSRFSGSLYAPRVRRLLQRARERAHDSVATD